MRRNIVYLFENDIWREFRLFMNLILISGRELTPNMDGGVKHMSKHDPIIPGK